MNVAIVGCGAIAHRWVRVLAADRRVTITALVDPDPANVLRLRTTHDLAGQPARSTVEEMVARDDVDVVVNLTPPDAHYAVSRSALGAGLHVLSESRSPSISAMRSSWSASLRRPAWSWP